MGMMLPKPVMSAVNESYINPIFRVGSSCVNGYRESMEDAHLVYMQDQWGFFGVFDGHVNADCSAYVAEQFEEVLGTMKVPITDERMKEIALNIDRTYLEAKRTGGSTGTFFIAMKEGSKMSLQIGNVGDSRVLAYKGGACVSVTTDHKPSLPLERRRIEAAGGYVENNRVNGSLAVSRAFGDIDYKKGSADPLLQQVIALADVTRIELTYGSKDFALLACDGVFEGDFSNEEVIEFAARQLELNDDPTLVANLVCEKAIEKGSKDNISCIIVQFRDQTDAAADIVPKRFVPGPFAAPTHAGFRKAYFAMSAMMGLSPEQALEMRYDMVSSIDDRTPEIEAELASFQGGPPASLDSKGRTAWFSQFTNPREGAGAAGGPGQRGMTLDSLQRMQQLQSMGIPLSVLMDLMQEVQGGQVQQRP